jgi:Ca2+-binding EF-hand superfamily protein
LPHWCRATRALSDKLFAQLDFDGSGGISFKEFLIGLEKMVMEEYCEDDEVRN